MKIYQKIYIIFYIFCFLFAPPFISQINFSFILGIYSLLSLIIKYPRKTINLIKSKDFITVVLLLLVYLIMYIVSFMVTYLIHNYDIFDNLALNLYSFFLNFVITFICSVYLVIKANSYGISKNSLIKYFIISSLIQLIICILCLLIPSVRAWTLGKMLKETNERLLKSPWVLERRFYGFSNNLLDLFGFGMGILSVLPLFYVGNNKKLILMSPLLLISCVLNSRTGIVIYIIGIVMFILFKLKTKSINLYKIIKYTVIGMVLLLLSYILVLKLSPNTITWIKNDISSFWIDDTESGTASVIYSKNFWILPDDFSVLYGKGYSVSAYSNLKVENIEHTDCGYINEIWKVGIIGLIVYLYIQVYIIKKCIKYDDEKNMKYFYMFVLIASFVFMIKASLYGYNPGNVLIYTLFVQYIYNNSCNKKGECV